MTVSIFHADGSLMARLQGTSTAPVATPTPAPPRPRPQLVPTPSISTPPRTSGQSRYDREQLGYGAAGEGPSQGAQKQPLSMQEFFEKVGRNDLAESFTSRTEAKNALVIGGSVVVLGALVSAAGLISSSPDPTLCDTQTCGTDAQSIRDRRASQAIAVGIVGAAVGGTLIGIGYALNPMPVSDAQAKQMADDYDQKLRHSLGLTVAPTLELHGGGVAMGLHF